MTVWNPLPTPDPADEWGGKINAVITQIETVVDGLAVAGGVAAHANTHAAGGSDPVTLTQAQITGLASALAALVAKAEFTAKGDLLAATGAGTETAVAVGSNGQVLTADNSAAGGVSWQTPASSSGVAASSFTEKGGLLAGTGAGTFADLPPGSNGQALVADSTAATGLKFTTLSLSAVGRPVEVTVGTTATTGGSWTGADFVHDPAASANPQVGGALAGRYKDGDAAINAALRSLGSYQGGVSGNVQAGCVRLSPGVFTITKPIQVDTGVKLAGAGMHATILDVQSSFSLSGNPAGSPGGGVIQPWWQTGGVWTGGHMQFRDFAIDFAGSGVGSSVHGLYFACQNQPSFFMGVDPYMVVDQVQVNMSGSGGGHGMFWDQPSGWYLIREPKVINCRVSGNSGSTNLGWGFNVGASDGFFVGNTANGMSAGGYNFTSGNTKVTACKAYYCGHGGAVGSANRGPGFKFTAGRESVAGCEAQDNYGNGFELSASNIAMAGCTADTNGDGNQDSKSAGFFISGSRIALQGCQAGNRSGGRGVLTAAAPPASEGSRWAVVLSGTPNYLIVDCVTFGAVGNCWQGAKTGSAGASVAISVIGG